MNKNFTIIEIKRALDKAKCKKSVGVDEIPNEVLKQSFMCNIMREFFQLCFDCGKVPADWTKSIIKPIPKSSENDKRVPLNYRGISLLSCMSKIYTSCLNNRITEYLDRQDLLVEEQNGFRKERSCHDHIFVLHSIIKERQK